MDYILNDNEQEIRQPTARDIKNHWTAVLILLGPISSVYRDLPR